jgi:threonine/homoserine/homoserine lactone efflux protein
LEGITLGFSATVSPGPFQAYLLSQATAHGWKKTVGAAFAPLVSDGPIILIILLILSQTPGWFLRGLNIAGGLFLLYLAYSAFRTFQTYTGTTMAPASEHNIFKAVLMNALSPGPWFFWSLLAGPILIEAWQRSLVDAQVFLFGFYSLLIGGNLLFIAFFATTRRFGASVTRILNGVAAIVLALFGVFQIWRGVSGG